MKNRAAYIQKHFSCTPSDKDVADQQALWAIFRQVCGANRGEPPVTRMADYLTAVAAELPVRINEEELLVGTDIYEVPFAPTEYQMYSNEGHYSADYDRFLRIGVEGVLRLVEESDRSCAGSVEWINRQAFRQVLHAFSHFIRRYAEEAAACAEKTDDPVRKAALEMISANCRHIAFKAPESFRQALQLIYFTQIFLHLEGLGANSMSFGRMDQYLYRFYRRDIDSGLLDDAAAEEWLLCFCERTSRGCDPSQNLALGGVDAEGRPVENELTRLFIRAQRLSRLRQPSLSLLLHPGLSDELWEEALQCVATGIGNPAFFANQTVVASLLNMDVPPADAREYAIIGCYEAVPQANAFGKTTALSFDLPKLILDYLSLHHQDAYTDFDEFYNDFLAFVGQQFEEVYLPLYQDYRDFLARQVASPFWACVAGDCIEKGLVPEQYGVKYNWIGLNMFGIGTLVDSLYVVQQLIFERRSTTLDTLWQQVSQNFPDDRFCTECRRLKGKFGTDNACSNVIARRLTEQLGQLAIQARLNHDVRLSPSLFRWMCDVETEHYPATPDGRRNGERLSYGAAPSELVQEVSPTSLVISVCSQRLDLFANGCPVTVSLPPDVLRTAAGRQKIRHFIETYCQLGGYHLQINVQDAEVLKDAKLHPENHPNLLIRISGHSQYFVVLNERLQDALIARTQEGR